MAFKAEQIGILRWQIACLIFTHQLTIQADRQADQRLHLQLEVETGELIARIVSSIASVVFTSCRIPE
ncbi:hypothetical protein AN414_19230 [Serratia marcescens]|nr:hypothetical protein AN414_19230 [Serratia marcescens]